MLVNSGKMSPLRALLCNFLSGLGVLLGGVIVLAVEYDKLFVGLVLAFGGGCYLYVVGVESFPRAFPHQSRSGRTNLLKQHILSWCLFVLGAALIGLVLLVHEHCVAEGAGGSAGGASDAHAGHGHLL